MLSVPRRLHIIDEIKELFPGFFLVATVGALGNGLVSLSGLSIADPLVVCLLLGIGSRALFGDLEQFHKGIALAPSVLLPFGIVFYALRNLNFMRIFEAEGGHGLLVVIIICVMFLSILFLGKRFGQKKQLTYLIGVGSAICGASAIAITSPAINAESDDISISLLSVTITAFFGLFILFPFLAIVMDLTAEQYSFFSGTLLQFTGFVKAAVSKTPFLKATLSTEKMVSLALSFKALKYLALVFIIPLLSSMTRGKLYIPPVVILFVLSGIAGTVFFMVDESAYTKHFIPYIQPVYKVSWSIAMSAIGLNADIRELLSNSGAKSMIMAFSGFFIAITAFFIGYWLIW